MSRAEPGAARRHGAAGVALLVLTALTGLQAVVAGVGADWLLPAGWLRNPAEWPRLVGRLAAVGFGLLLLLTAAGAWRFRRWAWWSGLAVGTLMLASLFTEAVRGGPGLVIEVGFLLLALWIPYLWLRRDAFR